nr:small RNA 2'-O-methyltransferase [Maniola hyperantus]
MIIAFQALLFFRETFVTVIERFLGPYYRKLSLRFKSDEEDDDDESDDHVFAEYDDEKGIVFYPPVYAQRYAAVSDCLLDERWCGNLEKVVDLGYHDMSFIKYLKDVPGIKHILGVDIESIPLRCSSDLLGCDNYVAKRETPLQVTLFQGNAADPDYRLIGCDAVVAIEMIEHMLPHDLERLIHTVFGFIKPRIAVFTTPNGDFNVLFKALQKNGLRRLDHMFEWSREQFHDWCSNIVARYPEYTVTCKGIGPGPPDTLQLGCCSQLALFVAKDYNKQPDLDLNTLALVAKTSSLSDLSHMIDSWESSDLTIENNMICAPPSVESYPELLYDEPSCITLALSPPFSLDSMECKDQIVQCNLDSEIGKNFLMFDDEVYFNVLAPRRVKYCRVYDIEDVASRLNCSTFLVKKFSKATQNLMAKNKMDSYAHTREIVNEIRNLTKILNFNKERMDRDFEGTWCNINWGTNAPYWNQYYRIVREYRYPFEVKTPETRILDLITEEINRLVDMECDEEMTSDMHKLEIPIGQLMRVVEHITTDVDKVKELLEWNGYEVIDDLVIYSRLTVDNISEVSQGDDWQEDTISDWDTTDVRSTSFSDGSTIVPDYYGLRLRRAIDQKVRKLRSLLTVDKDITTELDRVVCRLMKLAICTSKGRQNPPPISWMQCKLFDLLTLTEKSVERRRLQRYSLKAIEYQYKDVVNQDEIKMDHTGELIVSKYQNSDLPPGMVL